MRLQAILTASIESMLVVYRINHMNMHASGIVAMVTLNFNTTKFYDFTSKIQFNTNFMQCYQL